MGYKFFSFFRKKDRKRKKEVERSHREPIIVKIFKESESDKLTSVKIEGENTVKDEDSRQTSDGSINDRRPTDNGTETDREQQNRESRRFVPNQKYFVICVYAIMFVAVAGLLIITFTKLSSVWDFIRGALRVCSPFIGAALMSFIITPIVNWLDADLFEKLLKIKRPGLRMLFSILLSYIIIIGLLVLGMMKLLPQVGESLKELVGKLPDMYEDIKDALPSIEEKIPFIKIDTINDMVNNSLPDVIDGISNWIKDSIPILVSTSVAIVKSAINVLLTIAISIYMICDKRRIARAATQIVYSILPSKRATGFISTGKECFQIFGGFIIGKGIDSLIIGIICFIITSILRLPYPLLISVIVGITNMIPFFGPFIGAVPGILLYLCIDPLYALIFGIEILAIQQFDGWVLGPMILGDSTGIRPIWVIFGITVGGAYFGVLGMFLGVPFTAVIVHLIGKWLDYRLNKKKIEIT